MMETDRIYCIACLKTGRRYIGFEKNPAYFETAEKRLREYGTV